MSQARKIQTKNKVASKSKDIVNSVMSQITTNQIKMKPKAYFVMGSLFLGMGLAMAVILAFVFLSASVFHIRTQNPLGLLRLGRVGGSAFLHVFPFTPLMISILSIIAGLWLLKKYDISYRKNFLMISLSIVGAIIMTAIAADQFGVSGRLERMRALKPLYQQEHIKKGVVMGEVISISTNSAQISNPRSKETTSIVWDEHTTFSLGRRLQVGDKVGVVGTYQDGTIYAKGIHAGKIGQKNTRPNNQKNKKRPAIKGIRTHRFQ